MLQSMLEEMLQGYIACALWSSVGDDGEFLDDEHSESDIAPDTRAAMEKDCTDFIAANADHISAGPGDASQAGHDFWLTRCRHGTGFWDRDDKVWSKAGREAMDVYSDKAGNVELYIGDDGQIHA